MKKIIITTTSFGEYDREPIDILEKAGFEILLNPCGRKLKKTRLLIFAKMLQALLQEQKRLMPMSLKN